MPSSSCLPLPPPPPPRHSRHSSPLPSSLPDKYREEEGGRGEKPPPKGREEFLCPCSSSAFAQKGEEEGLSRHSSAQEEGRKRIAILLPFPPSPDEGRGKSHIFCHLRLRPRYSLILLLFHSTFPLFPAKFIAETHGGERCEGRFLAPFPRKTQYMRHIFFCQDSRIRLC